MQLFFTGDMILTGANINSNLAGSITYDENTFKSCVTHVLFVQNLLWSALSAAILTNAVNCTLLLVGRATE